MENTELDDKKDLFAMINIKSETALSILRIIDSIRGGSVDMLGDGDSLLTQVLSDTCKEAIVVALEDEIVRYENELVPVSGGVA